MVHHLEREDGVRIFARQFEALEPDRCQVLLLHTTLLSVAFDRHGREGVGRGRPLAEELLVDGWQVLGPYDSDSEDVRGLVDLRANGLFLKKETTPGIVRWPRVVSVK